MAVARKLDNQCYGRCSKDNWSCPWGQEDSAHNIKVSNVLSPRVSFRLN